MCGIGGAFGERPLAEPDRLARIFLDSLAHRGPDGEGLVAIAADSAQKPRPAGRGQLGLGNPLSGFLAHRRLSIIDLATGDQPMSIADGHLWIIYNGEIYNFLELRSELSAQHGVEFRTRSDTEVILQTYRCRGVEGFGRLNGMFAFAIYDARADHLILARDPVGVKPLYWSRGNGRIGFSSEIRPLFRTGMADRAVSPAALAQYLFYRFVPAPATLWTDVCKVVPGHALRFDRSGQIVAEVDFAAPPLPTHSSASGLAPELAAAVRRQMISDVPVGAFLSGGLDSSIMVSLMRRTTDALETYGVGFPDQPDEPSELAAAAWAATEMGTTHHGMELQPQDYFHRLPAAIAQVEEPVAHPGMLLQSDLSRLAHGNVKVVLTGQGADEPLGGYPRHRAARVLGTLSGPFGGLARSQLADRWAHGERAARIRRLLASPPGVERAAASFSPLRPEEAGAMALNCGPDLGREAILSSVARWWDKAAGLDDIARLLYVDVRTSLSEDLLLVGDKMSMAHSLEARVPFLDLKYLARVESIPGRQRVSLWGPLKQIQWDIGRRVLSPGHVGRLAESRRTTRKRGFDTPVSAWFRRSNGDALQEILTGSSSHIREIVNPDTVRSAVTSYLGSKESGYRMVLALFVLEQWLRNEWGDNQPGDLSQTLRAG